MTREDWQSNKRCPICAAKGMDKPWHPESACWTMFPELRDEWKKKLQADQAAGTTNKDVLLRMHHEMRQAVDSVRAAAARNKGNSDSAELDEMYHAVCLLSGRQPKVATRTADTRRTHLLTRMTRRTRGAASTIGMQNHRIFSNLLQEEEIECAERFERI